MRPARTRSAASHPAALGFGRRRWRDLVEQAREAAALGRRGIPPTTMAQAQLRTGLRRTGTSALPVEDPSAPAARTAFAAAVDAQLRAVTPEQRIARAAELDLACDAVDRLLTAAAQAEAQRTWQRQFGD
jgi:transposase-like protein